MLQSLTAGLSEKEVHDTLNNAVCKDKEGHEEISLGLLVGILTDPQNAAKIYRDLALITRDGLASVLAYLNQLVLEKYLRFNDVTRSQLLWLLKEMIRTSITNVDNLCLSLLRHAAGGDTSPRNLLLVDALLDIFQENRVWLDKYPFLVASIVYTYLRLIEDHNGPHLTCLRQKEVSFTVSLIRERMADCLVIGRYACTHEKKKTNTVPHNRANEQASLLNLYVRVFFYFQGLGAFASERREDTGVRTPVEGHTAQSEESLSEFQRRAAATADQNIQTISAVAPYAGHGAEARISHEHGPLR